MRRVKGVGVGGVRGVGCGRGIWVEQRGLGSSLIGWWATTLPNYTHKLTITTSIIQTKHL